MPGPRPTNINIGDKYGRLTVLERVANQRTHSRWRCQCDCGGEHLVLGTHLRRGTIASCGCLRHGPGNWNWGGYRDIPANLWKELIRGADGTKRASRVIPVEITIEDLWVQWERQGGKCALSGVDLTLWPRKSKTASVDRIDSAVGYTVANIQWVHKVVNMMKRTTGQAEFIEWCTRIANYEPPPIPHRWIWRPDPWGSIQAGQTVCDGCDTSGPFQIRTGRPDQKPPEPFGNCPNPRLDR